MNWWRAGGGNDPLFPGSICPLTRDHRRDGARRGVTHFTPSFSFPCTFFSLILKKKSCLLATLIFLDNSRKWQLAVRKRKMTSKYGLPIVAVRWTDCDSGTPIFWSVSFWCVGGGGDLLQGASVCPIISLYPPLSDDGRPKWDCVFPNVTVLENGERVTIKVEWQRKWQRSPSWQRRQTQTICFSVEAGLRFSFFLFLMPAGNRWRVFFI